MKHKFIFTLLLLFCAHFVKGQSFRELVEQTFDFSPHELSREQQQKLFPKLDQFFEFVINNKEEYLEPLREELHRAGHYPYFYFDGGLLLLEISSEPSDLQLVADALVKTDLRDIPPKIYLEHLLGLSLSGADVTDAALHILDDPKFQVYIPQHALLLNQAEGLKFILPRYDAALYVDKLITRYQKIENVKIKKQILDLFFYAGSCEADQFLLSVKENEEEPEAVRARAEQIVKIKSGRRENDTEKKLQARQQIRTSLNRISDEALHELNAFTKEIKTSYTCN